MWKYHSLGLLKSIDKLFRKDWNWYSRSQEILLESRLFRLINTRLAIAYKPLQRNMYYRQTVNYRLSWQYQGHGISLTSFSLSQSLWSPTLGTMYVAVFWKIKRSPIKRWERDLIIWRNRPSWSTKSPLCQEYRAFSDNNFNLNVRFVAPKVSRTANLQSVNPRQSVVNFYDRNFSSSTFFFTMSKD